MAISSSKTLDHWREVFRAAGESDVFHVIRQAIHFAASNHPDEFRIRKDKIVQMLFTAIPHVEKTDEDHRNDVKAMKEKEDDSLDNAIEDEEEEEEEESGRGNPVKSAEGLLAERTTTPSETWKIVSASKNGNIRLRRVLHDHDQTKPSNPQTTEHQPADKPLNLEGSLKLIPTFAEQKPDEPRNLEGSHHPEPVTAHPEPRSDDQEGSPRSNLLAATKRKLSEGCYHPFEPRPKKFCRRPLQFRISGARLLR